MAWSRPWAAPPCARHGASGHEQPWHNAVMKQAETPSSPPRKRRGRRPALPYSVPVYPSPDEKLVEQMTAALFTGHFFDDYLAALLARASAAVSAEFNEDITRSGLPVLHWRVLATLYDARGMPMSQIAELTLIPLPSLTRLVRRLELAGQVEIWKDE